MRWYVVNQPELNIHLGFGEKNWRIDACEEEIALDRDRIGELNLILKWLKNHLLKTSMVNQSKTRVKRQLLWIWKKIILEVPNF